MISPIERWIYLALGILFATIFIHNATQYVVNARKWVGTHNIWESFYPDDGPGLKEDDDDDGFFKQMNAEYDPNIAEKAEKQTNELDKEPELSPEEIDFIDADDIELPQQNNFLPQLFSSK